MKKILLTTCLISTVIIYSCAQSAGKARIGGPCEGCESIYENTTPFDQLKALVWLPDWHEDSTRLAVNGIVYQADGKTPAAGVILYIYHTDQTGVYPRRGDEKGWGKRHGYLRGWMKTNEKGEYKFFTRRPAAYPGRTDPAHIHIIVKEPGKNEYYIDDFMFDDDPMLTTAQRNRQENRGGSGILKIPPVFDTMKLKKAERHIYLGRNVPGYPKS